ncbi:hypothetical protein ID859_21380, partial [Xenorhabdus sp. 38]|nr:hypothetical protein [Xenorhabdus sp. 38]
MKFMKKISIERSNWRKTYKKMIPVLLVGGILAGNVAFVTNNVFAATTNNNNIIQTKQSLVSGQDEKSINELAEAFQF